MRWTIALCFILAQVIVHAQFDLEKRLQFDGADAAHRQLTGLGTPDSSTSGISAMAIREQQPRSGTAMGTDQLLLELTPAIVAYAPGMWLSITPSAANSGPATLNVNGVGAVPLMKHGVVPLDSGDLVSGIPFHAVFDGAAFQVTSQSHPACPAGYSSISRDVCLQIALNDSMSFYGANVHCVALGARLCTMAEWYQGCSMPGGFEPTLAAFEWVDHAANDNNYAKRVGSNSSSQFGCKLGGLATPLTQVAFRCCWDR